MPLYCRFNTAHPSRCRCPVRVCVCHSRRVPRQGMRANQSSRCNKWISAGDHSLAPATRLARTGALSNGNSSAPLHMHTSYLSASRCPTLLVQCSVFCLSRVRDNIGPSRLVISTPRWDADRSTPIEYRIASAQSTTHTHNTDWLLRWLPSRSLARG